MKPFCSILINRSRDLAKTHKGLLENVIPRPLDLTCSANQITRNPEELSERRPNLEAGTQLCRFDLTVKYFESTKLFPLFQTDFFFLRLFHFNEKARKGNYIDDGESSTQHHFTSFIVICPSYFTQYTLVK